MKHLSLIIPVCLFWCGFCSIAAANSTAPNEPKAVTTNDPSMVGGPGSTLITEQDQQDEEASSENPAADLAAKHLKEVLAWQVDFRKADKKDRPAVMKQRPSYSEYFAQFKDLADKHPKSPIEASALGWMAVNAPKAEDKSRSLKSLIDNHCDADVVANVAIKRTSFGDPTLELETQLKQIAKRSSNSKVKAAASYALLRMYDNVQTLSKRRAATQSSSEQVDDALKYINGFSIDDAEIESLYKSLSENYRDVKLKVMGRNISVGTFADAGLFKLRNLSLGCIAPDISGKDLDGVEFKLSEYHGKVVMLDFWGDW